MIHVGPAGWSYPDWDGIVYPRPKPRSFHPLPLIASLFTCVEINSSFYAMPSAKNAARWLELVDGRDEFRFLAKLNRDFTHGPELGGKSFDVAVETFERGLAPLHDAGKLSAVLLQFPVTFRRTPSSTARLERLREAFPNHSLAIELRHASWFEADSLSQLRNQTFSLLHIDLPAAKDHPPDLFTGTGPIGYLRLHGRNADNWFRRGAGRDERYDYSYGPSELGPIAAKARRLAQEHDEVYVVTNNHFEGQAVANGLELRAQLEDRKVAAPPELVERYPRLKDVTVGFGQQRLF